MAETDVVRAHLNRQYDVLLERLAQVERDRFRVNGPLSADFEEQAVERENDDVLDRLAAATASELAQVRHALDQIEVGHYGTCTHCHTAIAEARLHALPEATECTSCAHEGYKA